MQTLTFTLEVDRAFHAKQLIGFLKTLPHIKSVTTEKSSAKLSDTDWIKPGRPATDEEFEQMLDECEAEYKAGLGMPVEKARALTKKKIAGWRKQNQK